MNGDGEGVAREGDEKITSKNERVSMLPNIVVVVYPLLVSGKGESVLPI